ncbi:hypothetical protein [Bosea psychrotolerans]|uniref:STAS domain-containing protein n=1 Tax=Bosea psychrotolerans TaxID=1871628 RepID=A0A2S4MKX0_9HYPH|nr:hypothetical protein [Bosea psychrotolerans]POR55321.1 hypothetical protein CYD53_102207 [Bosea psychrotolerans]
MALKAVIHKAKHHGATVEISGATLVMRRVLLHEGIREPLVAFSNACPATQRPMVKTVCFS